jgi:AP2-like factor (ANT lineage)
MASGNNWLGFSISSQENPQPHQGSSSSPPATIDIAGATDFYGLPTQPDPDAQLGVPGHHASYGIMEAFNRGAHETQGERKKL